VLKTRRKRPQKVPKNTPKNSEKNRSSPPKTQAPLIFDLAFRASSHCPYWGLLSRVVYHGRSMTLDKVSSLALDAYQRPAGRYFRMYNNQARDHPPSSPIQGACFNASPTIAQTSAWVSDAPLRGLSLFAGDLQVNAGVEVFIAHTAPRGHIGVTPRRGVLPMKYETCIPRRLRGSRRG
jgi:hypothetical protein